MKAKYGVYFLIISLLLVILFFSCEKEQDALKPAYERLSGKWVILNTNILGTNLGEDGSYLQFNDCNAGNCPGIDYNHQDASTGSFTYNLEKDYNILVISDSAKTGGSYTGNWDILEFSNTNLRIRAETSLGEMTIDLRKVE